MTDNFNDDIMLRAIRDPSDVQEEVQAMLERDLDPDFALISDYVCGELEADETAVVRERLQKDPNFRELAEPLLLAWSIPPKSRPKSQDELLRAWLKLRRRAGMPPVPGQEKLDETEELAAYYQRQERESRRASPFLVGRRVTGGRCRSLFGRAQRFRRLRRVLRRRGLLVRRRCNVAQSAMSPQRHTRYPPTLDSGFGKWLVAASWLTR